MTDEFSVAIRVYKEKRDYKPLARLLWPNGLPSGVLHQAETYNTSIARLMAAGVGGFDASMILVGLLELVQNEDAFFEALRSIVGYSNTVEHADLAAKRMYLLPDSYRVSVIRELWDGELWSTGCAIPKVWAAVLKVAHQRGKVGSLILQNFDVDTAEEMFTVAREGIDGFYADGDTSRELLSRWRSRRVYRGGSLEPDDLSLGMSWTLSLDEARGFAGRMAAIVGGQPAVISAQVPKRDVLAVFDHESEVVVRSGFRAIQVVELGSLTEETT